jgi:DNA-binding XRE family transcriptional regulator
MGLLGICHRVIHTKRRPFTAHCWQRNPVPTTPQTLGETIRKKRVEEGLTQLEAAKKIGVSHATVVKWEANRTRPLGKFYQLAAAYVHMFGFDPGREPSGQQALEHVGN